MEISLCTRDDRDKQLCISSSNFAEMLAMVKTLLILEVSQSKGEDRDGYH